MTANAVLTTASVAQQAPQHKCCMVRNGDVIASLNYGLLTGIVEEQ